MVIQKKLFFDPAALAATLLLVCAIANASQADSAPLPSFEVASVKRYKPADPNASNSRWVDHPGKLTASDVRLRDLIEHAYEVKRYQISGPEWLGSERYNIQAQWPPSTPKEQVPAMLQSLLRERFKLVLHRETKNLPVYELQIAKGGPKLQAGSREGGTSLLTRPGYLQAENLRMAKLAESLSAKTGRPVLDRTGLDGIFNFELQFTPEDLEAGSMGQANAAEGVTTGPSLFTAIRNRLGLKLVAEKRPVEILVIERAEKVPVEN